MEVGVALPRQSVVALVAERCPAGEAGQRVVANDAEQNIAPRVARQGVGEQVNLSCSSDDAVDAARAVVESQSRQKVDTAPCVWPVNMK